MGLFSRRPEYVSLEEQLLKLAKCGIKLNDGITKDMLLNSFDRETYENDPYVLLLTMMGSVSEDEEGKIMSNNIYHFDTECIEDHGDYSEIAKRLMILAGKDFPLLDITDYVDVEKETAWISFKLDGKEYKWGAKVEGDWIDPQILEKFKELLINRNTEKKFTYFDLGGQDCLLGCCDKKEFNDLKKSTGLKFKWL